MRTSKPTIAAVRNAAVSAFETLETRRLMSSINWINKGTGAGAGDTDAFNATFGANATLARSIVQRGIDDYERVITNFNGFGGRNTYTLTVDAANLAGNVAADTNVTSYDLSLKPQVADITMDVDAAGGGWYFDPTPGTATLPEDSDFTSFVTPFAADRTTSSGRDFYRSFIHELTHAMGLSATASRITGTEIDVGDDPLSSDPADRLTTIDVNGNGSADFTMTTSGGRHLYEGGGGYVGPVHPNEIINAGRAVSNAQVRRGLISDNVAGFLRDVFDYTIVLPSTINTFWVQFNNGANNVTVNGDIDPTDLSDLIDLEEAGTAMRFEVNGTSETIEGVEFGAIIVNAGEGNDDIDVDQIISGKTVIINGENGNDRIQMAPATGDIDSDIDSDLTTNGGSGTDTITFNDTSDGVGADTYDFTFPSLVKGARTFAYNTTELLQINNGSPQASTYNISSLLSTVRLEIVAGGSSDTFNVGNDDYDNNILGDVDIDALVGTDILNIEDDLDTGADTYTLTHLAFNKANGGTVTFDSISDLTLNGNNEANLYNVDFGSGAVTGVTINAGQGNDTLDIGGASNDLDNAMGATILFRGQNGIDKLDANDSGDGADAEDYTLTFDGLTKSSSSDDLLLETLEEYHLVGNDGSNNITIEYGDFLSNHNVTVGGGGGDDTITSLVGGTFSLFDGNATVQGGPGADTIVLNDAFGSVANDYTLTSTTLDLSGPGLTFGLMTYTAETLDLTTSSIDSTIRVNSTLAGTQYFLRADAGNDTINFGGPGRDVSDIDGAVDVFGGTGVDHVNYNDDNSTSLNTYTVGNDTLSRSGTANIDPNGMESIVVNCGTRDDFINVISTLATTPVTVNGSAGGDIITVGNSQWDGNVAGPVTINGSGGSDLLRINDFSDTGADTYTVTSTQTTKNVATAGAINYNGVESYFLDASDAVNTINVNSTFAGSFRVHGNNSADTINVVDTAVGSWVTVDGGAGLDNVNVNSDGVGASTVHFDTAQGLAALNLSAGGVAVMEANGNRLIETDALSIALTAQLDLNDNDLLFDYSAGNPLALTQLAINVGRNNGAWDGFGITSTSARTNPNDNTTLGAMLSTDYNIVYGANGLFNGVDPDNTAVLIKYTYYGDTDFSGSVDFDDYVRIDLGFNQGRTGWLNGDFDGNASIDFDDYVFIDLGFNTQGATL